MFKHFNDKIWLENREIYIDSFLSESSIILDFSECEWIDLLPANDLLLHIGLRIVNNLKTTIKFPNVYKQLRVLRFFRDSGFLKSIERIENENNKSCVKILFENLEKDISSFNQLLRETSLPSPILNYISLIPFQFLDSHKVFNERVDVYNFCKKLKDDAIGFRRGSGLGVPSPLLYHIKNFFSTVLPEIIDNIRIHKRNPDFNYFTVYMRFRKRDDSGVIIPSQRFLAEPKNSRTFIKDKSYYLWEHDFVEAVISDIGPSIQSTYIDGWNKKKTNKRLTVPRLPDGTRVGGKNGDELILKGVFKQTASSIPDYIRKQQNLPQELTGLYSIKNLISGSNWFLSVRSGLNNVLVYNDPLTNTPKVEARGRYSKINGVHFFLRYTSDEGRVIKSWPKLFAKPEDLFNEKYWVDNYPNNYNEVIFIDKYELPEIINPNSTVVCRPAHIPNKTDLYRFLKEIEDKKIRLIFSDVPSYLALWLYTGIKFIIRLEKIEIFCPIVTNSYRINIPNVESRDVVHSFIGKKKLNNSHYWWQSDDSIIKSPEDLFTLNRFYDSKIFWDIAFKQKDCFLEEPVKWTNDLILEGGYIYLPTIAVNSSIKKLIRKRCVTLCNLLNVSEVIPSSESLRNLSNEINRNIARDYKSGNKLVLTDVTVTGETIFRMSKEIEKDRILNYYSLPLLIYPKERIKGSNSGNEIKYNEQIRVFNWLPQDSYSFFDLSKGKYSRIGNTNRIRRIPEKKFEFHSIQPPPESYNVWQIHSLLNIGHFSYNNNHFYVWLDLLRYLSEGSSDAQEGLSKILKKISDWSNCYFFYSPQEVSELLTEKLITLAHSLHYIDKDKIKVFPIDSVVDFSDVNTNTYNIISRDLQDKTLISKSIAIFIDDAMVSGKTNLKVTRFLKMLGFGEVRTIVLLNRSNPLLSLREYQNHISLWELYIPLTGSEETCSICRGIKSLQTQSAYINSPEVETSINAWINRWSLKDNLRRIESKIEETFLEIPIKRKHGSLFNSNLKLGTNYALTTWVLDIISRLGYYDILDSKRDKALQVSMSEIIAGIIFHFWDSLSVEEKIRLSRRLLDELWSDGRFSARSLIIVAFMSISKNDLKFIVSDLLVLKTINEGIPHIDIGIFIYLILHIVSNQTSDVKKYINDIVGAFERPKEDPFARTKVILQTLNDSEIGIKDYELCLNILGMPDREIEHFYIFKILALLKSARTLELSKIENLLSQLCLLIEPISSLLESRESLFDDNNDCQTLKAYLREIGLSRNSIRNYQSSDSLVDTVSEMSEKLLDFLSLRISLEKPSFREILWSEYLHYIPFLVHQIIYDLEQHTDIISEDIFELPPQSVEEEILIGTKISDYTPQDYSYLDKIKSMEVIIAERIDLEVIIKDLLLDVKHPIQNNIPLYPSKKKFMKIRYKASEMYEIIIENKALLKQYEESKSKSWSEIQNLVKKIGGKAEQSYTSRNQHIIRTIKLPYVKPKKSRYNNNE